MQGAQVSPHLSMNLLHADIPGVAGAGHTLSAQSSCINALGPLVLYAMLLVHISA